jgi:hypothetical protein
MWRCYLRSTPTTLVLELALSTLLLAGTAEPAKRPAPTPPPTPAPTEAEQALTSFKAKAEQFQRFLAQNPVFLSNQDFSKSATGQIYYHVRIKLLENSFDVQRSDSLVSPFIGYLNLVYEEESNTSCGDVVVTYPKYPSGSDRDVYGYSTYEKAIAHAHDCFQRRRNPPVENMRLIFAYQDRRWIFKDAIRPLAQHKDGRLLAALGRAEPPHHYVADNRAWEALIK